MFRVSFCRQSYLRLPPLATENVGASVRQIIAQEGVADACLHSEATEGNTSDGERCPGSSLWGFVEDRAPDRLIDVGFSLEYGTAGRLEETHNFSLLFLVASTTHQNNRAAN